MSEPEYSGRFPADVAPPSGSFGPLRGDGMEQFQLQFPSDIEDYSQQHFAKYMKDLHYK